MRSPAFPRSAYPLPDHGTTFLRFIEQPAGTVDGDGVITGTLTIRPANQIAASFVVTEELSLDKDRPGEHSPQENALLKRALT